MEQHRHDQFTKDDHDEYSDEAMARLIASIADDGISSGLMFMAATPGLHVSDDKHASIVLAESWRRALAPVARTLQAGDVYDGLTRFINAARSEAQ